MGLSDLPQNLTTDFLKHVVKRQLMGEPDAEQVDHDAARQQITVDQLLIQRGVLTEHTAESILRLLYQPEDVKVIAGYQILAKLGEGATAKVYKALQLSIDREVALKVMSRQFTRHKLGRERFLREASESGLHTLKGHRSVGGMRASIYNAMPEEGVTALIDFMREFERRHG